MKFSCKIALEVQRKITIHEITIEHTKKVKHFLTLHINKFIINTKTYKIKFHLVVRNQIKNEPIERNHIQ